MRDRHVFQLRSARCRPIPSCTNRRSVLATRARRSRPQAPQSAARRHSPPQPRRGTPPPPSPPDSAARVRPTRRPQPPSVRPPFGGSSSMPRAGSPLAFRPRVVASSRARPSARAASSPRPSLAAPPAMLPDPHGRTAPPFAPQQARLQFAAQLVDQSIRNLTPLQSSSRFSLTLASRASNACASACDCDA